MKKYPKVVLTVNLWRNLKMADFTQKFLATVMILKKYKQYNNNHNCTCLESVHIN